MDSQQPSSFPFPPMEPTPKQSVYFQKFTVTICIIIVILIVGGIFLLASKSDQPDSTASAGNQLTPFSTGSPVQKSVAGTSTDNGTYGPAEPSGEENETPSKKPTPTDTTAPVPTEAPTATPQPTSAPEATATPAPTATPTPTSTPTPTPTETPTETPSPTP